MVLKYWAMNGEYSLKVTTKLRGKQLARTRKIGLN
jgi:hypothetical protein